MRYTVIAGIALFLVVIFLLGNENKAIKCGNVNEGFMAYNWGNKDTAAHILTALKKDPLRVQAVKRIIYLDYFFMILYGFLFCYGLRYLAGRQTNAWLEKAMWFGFACIIFTVVVDFIQDTATLCNVTPQTLLTCSF